MTLDEAIEHAKEVARICEDSACAANHMQLAEWLRQARGADAAARWYTKKLRDAETENATLRELVRDMWLQLLNAYDRKEVDEFADRMRELGIEVDDGAK